MNRAQSRVRRKLFEPFFERLQRAVGAAIKTGLQRYPDPMATAFRARAGELLAAWGAFDLNLNAGRRRVS